MALARASTTLLFAAALLVVFLPAEEAGAPLSTTTPAAGVFAHKLVHKHQHDVLHNPYRLAPKPQAVKPLGRQKHTAVKREDVLPLETVVACSGYPHAIPVQVAIGVRPHQRKSGWQGLGYGKCREFRMTHDQVFLFHFPQAIQDAELRAGNVFRSNTTVAFPRRASQFFRNRPVVVIGGNGRLLSANLPRAENLRKSQMVLIDAFAARKQRRKAKRKAKKKAQASEDAKGKKEASDQDAKSADAEEKPEQKAKPAEKHTEKNAAKEDDKWHDTSALSTAALDGISKKSFLEQKRRSAPINKLLHKARRKKKVEKEKHSAHHRKHKDRSAKNLGCTNENVESCGTEIDYSEQIDPRDRNYASAMVKFEDRLKPEMEAQRQQISSLNIPLHNGKDFHQVYSFRSGDFYAILENQRGSEVLDFQDINFARNKSYVAIRVGLGVHRDYRDAKYYSLEGEDGAKRGEVRYKNVHDLDYPQRLLFFEVSSLGSGACATGVSLLLGAVVAFAAIVVGL